MSASLRIIFAGTPEFAAHHLDALTASEHEVVACYTQPDRPAGRGKKLTPSPVKARAEAQGIAVYQPHSLKDAEQQALLARHNADIMVVVAYGLLLPQAVLDTPRLGCINVHASLLPRWRGAAPIQRAIAAGDRQTGITIMQMDKGLDTGDMLERRECAIGEDDTAASLHDTLLALGGPALLSTLEQLAAGRAQPQTQDDAQSSYAAKISKAEAALDWRLPATVLERQIRAFNPFPIAYTHQTGHSDKRIRVWQAHLGQPVDAPAGTICALNRRAKGSEGVVVACGEGSLVLTRLQLPGKKALAVADILRGNSQFLHLGDTLGERP